MFLKYIEILKKLNFRTIVLNFYLLPFNQAIHLPILISNKCILRGLYKGGIQLNCNIVKFGLIQIGYNAIGILDYKYERSIIELGKKGKIIFKGRSYLGNGTRISVSKKLLIGDNVSISGNTTILCYEGIQIGNDTLISWDCLVLDSDLHSIYQNTKRINENKPIIIGNHVWIGAKSTIMKGTIIKDGIIIGAGSLCTSSIYNEKSIYAGNPIKEIKTNIEWQA